MKPGAETDGRSALKTWLSGQERGAQAKLSRDLGVSDQLVSLWISGSCRPNELARLGLEKLLGIKATDWDTEEEHKQREKFAALAPPPLPAATAPDDEGVRHVIVTDGAGRVLGKTAEIPAKTGTGGG